MGNADTVMLFVFNKAPIRLMTYLALAEGPYDCLVGDLKVGLDGQTCRDRWFRQGRFLNQGQSFHIMRGQNCRGGQRQKTEGTGLDSGRGEMKQNTLTQTQLSLLTPHDSILRGGQDFTVHEISSAADTSGVL